MPGQSMESQDVLQRLLESRTKALEKAAAEEVNVAVRENVPLESIAGTIQQMAQQEQSQVNPEQLIQALQQQLQQAQQPTQQPEVQPQAVNQALAGQPQQQVQPRRAPQINTQGGSFKNSVLKSLQNFGRGASEALGVSTQEQIKKQQLENQVLQQELSGKKPLQAGEREKLDIEAGKGIKKLELEQKQAVTKRMDEFFDPILRKEPQSPELNKTLSQIELSINALDNITNLLQIDFNEATGEINMKNKELLRSKDFRDKNRQSLIRARDMFINKTLRRDSGATVGEEEEKAFKRIAGFDIGIKSYFQNPDVIAQAIVESKQQSLRDRSRLLPNETRDREIKALLQQGHSKESIFGEFERRGEI